MIVIDLLDWTVPRKHCAQTKPTDATVKEAAHGAGRKKKKKVAEKPWSRACRRQGKKTSLWLGTSAPASQETEGDGEDTNDSVEEETPTKGFERCHQRYQPSYGF